MALQIRSKLRTVAWPTGATNVVFGTRRVVAFAGTPTEQQIPPGFPWCLVGVGTGEPDEDHPDFITQTFDIITGVEVAGDPMGEFAVIGGSVANLGKSVGRGITEVDERVRAAVQNLTGDDGAKILLSSTAIDTPAVLGRGKHMVISVLTLTALCTSQLHYSAPQQLARSGTTWTWEGSHCSDRFDFMTYVLRRATGSTPTGPTSGTAVYTGTAATTTHTAVSGDTYAVFAQYSARQGTSAGTADGNSGNEVGSYLTE